VVFTQIINSQKKQIQLCEQCAKEKNHLVFFNPVSVSELFSNILGVGANSCSQKTTSCKNCVGKSPATKSRIANVDNGDEGKEILKLKAELENCIKSENYEQAAVIRDKINEIHSSSHKKDA